MWDNEKKIINTLYHGAVIAALSMAYAQLGKMVMKKATPKLDPDVKDLTMLAIDVTAASATKDYLVKQGIIPADIMK